MACRGPCIHVTCENGACSAELECSDSSMIVVCLCCADAAKPFSKDKVSQGSDAFLGESDDCRIGSDTAEEALYEAAEWRHCDQGHNCDSPPLGAMEDVMCALRVWLRVHPSDNARSAPWNGGFANLASPKRRKTAATWFHRNSANHSLAARARRCLAYDIKFIALGITDPCVLW